MEELTKRLEEAIQKHCRLTTTPVAIKLAEEDEETLKKAKHPMRDLGHRLAVCQGMTLARTIGWTMAFRDEDHACPLPRVFMGHVEPGKFLEGSLGEFYQEEPEHMRTMEASYPRWPLGVYKEIRLSPADRAEFVPDLVVVYGTPAQILTLIQAANFRKGPGIAASSTGRYGCSFWIAGVVQAQECTYMVPGPGERIFAGTQDQEMSFAVPYSKAEVLIEGLQFIRSRGSYRYPVPNLAVLSEPRIPGSYHRIIPRESADREGK